MKPYLVITGTVNEVELFEDKVSAALDEGYDLCSKLSVKPHTNPATGHQELLLVQALILDDEDDDLDLDIDEDDFLEDEGLPPIQ